MKKTLLFVTTLSMSIFSFGQTGINTLMPKATLDVVAKATDPSTPEGVIAPRLSGDEIKGKDAQYGTDQTGIIIYATSAVTTPSGTKTANLTEAGYYYFNGTEWINLAPSNSGNLKLVGSNNYLTIDAGTGSNGTNAGTGSNNLGLGQGALNGISTASNNIALGNDAVSANIGGNNIGIGTSAMNNAPANTLTRDNIAIGDRALLAVASRTNIGIGELTLQRVSGNENIAIGSRAGNTLTTGENNILLGTNAQPNVGITADNQLNIGNWIYGDNGKIGIGTATIPTEMLHIGNGNVRIQAINTANGTSTDRIVVADANGVLKTIAPLNAANFDFSSVPTSTNNNPPPGLAVGKLYEASNGSIKIVR